MKKNQLTTTRSTTLILGKSKSLMGITKRLLQSKGKGLTQAKASQELATHEGITIIGDLMWEKESREMNWDDAMEYAKNLRLGGYDDWRLPTIEELGEVVKLCGGEFTRRRDNAIDNRGKRARNKKNVQYQEAYKLKEFASDDYWSSTSAGSPAYDHVKPLDSSFGDDSCCAWIVYFGIGREKRSYKTTANLVRCVRAGE